VLIAVFTLMIGHAPRPVAARLRAGPQMAALLGVDVDRTISLTFVIGAAGRGRRVM